MDGDVDVALSAARRASRASRGGGLVGDRLVHLNEHIGGVIVPGEGAREPTADIPIGSPPVLEPIPDPPPPPPPPTGGN